MVSPSLQKAAKLLPSSNSTAGALKQPVPPNTWFYDGESELGFLFTASGQPSSSLDLARFGFSDCATDTVRTAVRRRATFSTLWPQQSYWCEGHDTGLFLQERQRVARSLTYGRLLVILGEVLSVYRVEYYDEEVYQTWFQVWLVDSTTHAATSHILNGELRTSDAARAPPPESS